jgi:DNA-binding response OmpR family regulator
VGEPAAADAPLAQQFRLLCLHEKAGEVRVNDLVTAVGRRAVSRRFRSGLDALVRRLRDRISTVDPTHQYIDTLRGHGLRLENPPLVD